MDEVDFLLRVCHLGDNNVTEYDVLIGQFRTDE